VKPIIKWAGGKSQLLDELKKRMPKDVRSIAEPFAGGLALSLEETPEEVLFSDMNEELMNLYEVIGGRNGVGNVMRIIRTLGNDEETFYAVRGQDVMPGLKKLSKTKRAARFLYLNKTAFNGLYRVNSKGFYNVPFGRYERIAIDEDNLRQVGRYLRGHCSAMVCGDCRKLMRKIKPGSFCYIDPPYHATFTAYNAGGFGEEDQKELKRQCDALTKRGVKWMLSNTDDAFVNELYEGCRIDHVKAHRFINSDGKGRSDAGEVIVMNYDEDGNILGRR